MVNKKLILPEQINQVRSAADINEVIGSRIQLNNRGQNLWGLCPFHNDTTPSLKVDRQRGIWYCFSCNEGGNVFDFIMQDLKITFPEAVRELAQRFGISLSNFMSNDKKQLSQKTNENILGLLELANNFFMNKLQSREGDNAKKYLTAKRGLSNEIISAFELGWAPGEWKSLERYLNNQLVPINLAVKAGLLIKRDKKINTTFNSSISYDRFRNRIIFPIRDINNKIVSFGGRSLNNNLPKYLNGPENPFFQKSHTLYNLNYSQKYIRRKGRVLIVEGYFDVITLTAYGFQETVAPLGTALSSHQVRILKTLSTNLILIFDGDIAGNQAAVRVLPTFLREGLAPYVVILPPSHDPDSFLTSENVKTFELMLKKANPLIEVVLNKIIEQGNKSTPEGRSKISITCGEILKQIKDPVIQSGYLDQVANSLKLSTKLIAMQIGLSYLTPNKQVISVTYSNKANYRRQNSLRSALELALASPEAARILLKGKALETNKDKKFGLAKIAYCIATLVDRGIDPTPTRIILELSDQKIGFLVAKLAQRSPRIDTNKIQEMAWELTKQIYKHQLYQEQKKLKKAIADAEVQNDFKHLTDLQLQRKKLIQKISSLYYTKDLGHEQRK